MRALFFIIPAIVIAVLVLLVFGFLGVCAMTACLGSGNPAAGETLIAAAVLAAATLPLAASITVFLAQVRVVRPGRVVRALLWAVIGLAAALGVYQIVTDAGDAIWAGVPLVAFSALMSCAMESLPPRG